MIGGHLNMTFGGLANRAAQRKPLAVFQEGQGTLVGLTVPDPIGVVQRPDLCRKKLVNQRTVLSMSDGDGQAPQQSSKIFTCHFEHAASLQRNLAASCPEIQD
jgi:hypothetical protein